MKAINIYYSIQDMADLLGVNFTNITYRFRKLGLKPCFEDGNKKGHLNPKKYYSIDKFNLISCMGTKVNNYAFIVSDFNNVTQTFVEFQSKINENGFN